MSDYIQTDVEMFMEWYWGEIRKGLIDIRFFVDAANSSSTKEFFREVNQAIYSPDLNDPLD